MLLALTFWSYVWTWRLAVALALWCLAIVPIRKAYRLLRVGDVWLRGTVEEVFISSFLVALSAAVYPFAIVGIVILWWLFLRKRLLSLKGFLASLIAVACVALYTGLVCWDWHLPYWW